MTLDDFRAKLGRAIGQLSPELARAPSIVEVAAALGMSARSLHRWCQRAEGMTPARAIERRTSAYA